MTENWFANLSPELIAEITAIVFDYPAPPVQPCDMIFVFGGSHPGLWQTAAQAYHQGLGKTLLVTGGYNPNAQHHHAWKDSHTPESHVIRRELVRLGVPENAICIEDRSTNTLENVVYALEVFDFSPVRSILAVCRNYGVGRQCRTLRQQVGAEVEIIPFTFDTQAGPSQVWITRSNWMENNVCRELVLSQAAAIYQYGQRGHLTPLTGLSAALEDLLAQLNQP